MLKVYAERYPAKVSSKSEKRMCSVIEIGIKMAK